ncbi:MAG: Flp pilus assembly protein CpaB [Rhodopirellula sp.]|nr:Flp pilus assembly protein CpaB [Rhodopirellula sp.]
MNKKASPGILILGIFAVLFGLLGAYAAKKHLQAKAPEVVAAAAPQVEKWTVPTAVADLPANRTITQSDLLVLQPTREELGKMPLPPTWMNRTSQIIGRTLRQPVPKGQAFEPALFYPEGIGPDVASQLAAGERAMTIPFEGCPAEAGLITPGAHVDILFRTSTGTAGPSADTTVTLLEDVRVLAIDRQTLDGAAPGEKKSGATVTLAVSPMQTRALKVVEGRGSLTLALRSGDDRLPANSDGPRTLDDLLGVQQEKPFTTEIYRRGHLTTVSYLEGKRQVIYEDTPYGMPVAKEPRLPSSPDLTQSGPLAAQTSRPAGAPPAGRNAHRNTFGTSFPLSN